LRERISKSEGWKKFPILDILASFIITIVDVVLVKIYNGNLHLGIPIILVLGGIVVALPFHYVGRRAVAKPRDEAKRDIIYSIRIFLIAGISSVLSSLLLKYI